MGLPAQRLTNAICTYLAHIPKCHFWKNGSGAVRQSDGKGHERFVRFGQKGVPDLCAVIDKQALAIEVKAGHDRMSDDQLLWKEKFERAGGIYVIARDAGDVIAVVNKLLEGGK